MKRLTLDQAAVIAFRSGLAPSFFTDLNQHRHDDLARLRSRTSWRLPASPLITGHLFQGSLVLFHDALRRAAYRRSVRMARQPSERLKSAMQINDDGAVMQERAGRSLPGAAIALLRDSADAFDVASDAFEEAGDAYEAAAARERAHDARQQVDKIKAMYVTFRNVVEGPRRR